MDERAVQKNERKFNIVDVIILILVLAVAGYFVVRYTVRPGSAADPSRKDAAFVMLLENVELFNERFEGRINVGDTLRDRNTGTVIGTITDMEIRPSRSYGTDSEGVTRLIPRPEFSCLIITVEGEGFRPEEGGLNVAGLHFYVNRESDYVINDASFGFRAIRLTIADKNDE
jgi:hypothetical protein